MSRLDESWIADDCGCVAGSRFDVEVQVVFKACVDSLGVFSPGPFTLEVENVVFEPSVDRRSIFREHFHFQSVTDEVGVVVDVDVLRIFLSIEAVEVEPFSFVLADVVSNDDIAIGLFHDAAKPHVVVAVVVLDEGVDAVVVGIESTSIHSFFTDVAVRLVVLDSDAVGIETEDAVAGVKPTAVGKRVEFVNRILADSCDDTVTPRLINKVSRHINVGPKMLDRF